MVIQTLVTKGMIPQSCDRMILGQTVQEVRTESYGGLAVIHEDII